MLTHSLFNLNLSVAQDEHWLASVPMHSRQDNEHWMQVFVLSANVWLGQVSKQVVLLLK